MLNEQYQEWPASNQGRQTDNIPGSSPQYLAKHSGPVLVLGNAFCLSDDYERARQLYPSAPVIAVNGAAGFTKAIALFTQHASKFPNWIEMQQRFGDGFTTHSAGTPRDRTKFGHLLEHHTYVDYWWEHVAAGGTSTWGARRLAKFMGFDLVVLCGMPLEKGGYSDGRMAKNFQNDDLIQHYRNMVMADTDFHAGVISMSGWTRKVFGG